MIPESIIITETYSLLNNKLILDRLQIDNLLVATALCSINRHGIYFFNLVSNKPTLGH